MLKKKKNTNKLQFNEPKGFKLPNGDIDWVKMGEYVKEFEKKSRLVVKKLKKEGKFEEATSDENLFKNFGIHPH